jgi:hypothetical protein
MMPRSPYPGFTKLNRRRLELVDKKYKGGGLSETEEREMEMLGKCVGAMCFFRWPLKDIDKDFREKTGMSLDEFIEQQKKESGK